MPFNLVAPTYTASRLERMAITLLKGRIKGSTTVPIDIDFILEQEPGVLLDYIPGIKTRFGVAGVVYREDHQRFRVIIDAEVADSIKYHNFYRFTVAEEFAHIKLHKKIGEESLPQPQNRERKKPLHCYPQFNHIIVDLWDHTLPFLF